MKKKPDPKRQAWLSELQIGDEVHVITGRGISERIGTVTKRGWGNPDEVLFIDDVWYNQYGNDMLGGGWGTIHPLTEETRRKFQREKLANRLSQVFWWKFDLSLLEKVSQLVKEAEDGKG